MYLENIFSSADIKRDLPEETRQFEVCDKFLKNLMKKRNSGGHLPLTRIKISR